jgi:hypothetical protein
MPLLKREKWRTPSFFPWTKKAVDKEGGLLEGDDERLLLTLESVASCAVFCDLLSYFQEGSAGM